MKETIEIGTKACSLNDAMHQGKGNVNHKTGTDLKEAMNQGTGKRAATKPDSLRGSMKQ